jgi:hypothetical protein
MTQEEGFWDKLVKSGTRVFSPTTLLGYLWRFLVFGIITGLPYLLFNLNQVGIDMSQGVAWYMVLWGIIKAFFSSISYGFFIASSTVWWTLANANTVIDSLMLGNMFYFVIVIIPMFITIYQPTSLVADLFDLQYGKNYNVIAVSGITIVLLLGFSAMSFFLLNGQTFLDVGLQEQEETPQGIDVGEPYGNQTNQTSLNSTDELVNSIDLLSGGAST